MRELRERELVVFCRSASLEACVVDACRVRTHVSRADTMSLLRFTSAESMLACDVRSMADGERMLRTSETALRKTFTYDSTMLRRVSSSSSEDHSGYHDPSEAACLSS